MGEIVKVQKPIQPKDAPIMIYAEGKKNLVLANDLIASAQTEMGSDLKAFFRAEWDDENKAWHLGERVEDQPW